MNIPGHHRIGSAGIDFHGAQTKILNPDEEGNGEVGTVVTCEVTEMSADFFWNQHLPGCLFICAICV